MVRGGPERTGNIDGNVARQALLLRSLSVERVDLVAAFVAEQQQAILRNDAAPDTEKRGGPRRDRTGDLLIANEPEGESEQVPEGLTAPQTKKEDEDETG